MLKQACQRVLLLLCALSILVFLTSGCQQLSNPGYTQRLQRLIEVSDTLGGGESTSKPASSVPTSSLP